MTYRSNPQHHSGERYARASDDHAVDRHDGPRHHHGDGHAYHSDHGHAHAQRVPTRAPQAAARVARSQPAPPSSDYAFIHGKRQVRIGPVAFWICVGTLVIMAGWTLMTATYFAFEEDV